MRGKLAVSSFCRDLCWSIPARAGEALEGSSFNLIV